MKHFFIACVVGLMLCACDSNSREYQVEGNVTGLEDGTVLQLVPMSHDGDEPFAEATVSGGKFEFQGVVGDSLPFPICVNIMVKDAYGIEAFMLENGKVTITGKTVKSEPDESGKCSYKWEVSVKGAALNDKLNGYKAKRAQLDKQFNDYHQKYADIINRVSEARQAKDSVKVSQIMETEEYKAFDKVEKDFFNNVETTFRGIIDENKDTYWGPMMAIYLMSYFTSKDKEMYDSFSAQAQQSWYGKRMIDEIMPAGVTGEKAKEFTVQDEQGNKLKMGDLAKGKKVLLIDFWASWCKPCRNEIPNVKKLYELYKDKGLEVVSVSIDQNEKAWKKAVKDENLQWPNFLDRLGAADVYKVKSIPAMFLIDASNLTVIASGEDARGEALAAKLAELFAAK